VAPPLFMTIDASNWTESHVQPTTTNLPPRSLAAFAGLSVPVG
jgi:hypothetical protein